MARTLDIILRDTIGNLNIQIIQMTAALEEAAEKIKELEAKVAKEGE